MLRWRGDGYPRLLLLLFAGIWLGLAIAPSYRQDWLLENLIVVLAVPWLIHHHRRQPFSATAYSALFGFFVLHEVGAHYTYSQVPYDAWLQQCTGSTLGELLGWQRNHYDRLIHFLYGLLISPAAIELLDQRTPQRGLWRWLLPVLFIVAHSAIYEQIEWLAASVFGGDLGQAYVGAQGDPWDAQKDSALALLGALIAVSWRRARR